MSAQISRSIGKFAFASALLGFGAVNVPSTAFADDCLTSPNSSAPSSGHWYYRTDRTNQRKCWYLRAGNQEQGAAQVAGGAPPADSNSFARFKDFMAQQRGPKLSDQDVAKLYAEFLEWRRGNTN